MLVGGSLHQVLKLSEIFLLPYQLGPENGVKLLLRVVFLGQKESCSHCLLHCQQTSHRDVFLCGLISSCNVTFNHTCENYSPAAW